MTSNYHTPIPSSPKQPANAATINSPLGELDAQLTNHEERIVVLEGDSPNYSGIASEFLNGEGNFAVPTGTGDVNGHVIQEEGVSLPQRTNLNFVGAGVVVTNEAGGTQVSVPGGGGHVIEYNDAPLPQRAALSIISADTEVEDDAGNDETRIRLSPNHFGRFLSGRWYGAHNSPNYSTNSRAANVLNACPIFFGRDVTITDVGSYIQTGVGSGLMRIGIYEDVDGWPGDLILDCGALDVSSSGSKSISITPLNLQMGYYWLVVLLNGTVTMFATSSGYTVFQGFNGVSGLGGIQEPGGVTANFTYGALPATFPAFTESQLCAVAMVKIA